MHRRRERQIPAVHGQSAHSEGGHKSIHPELGTLHDFRRLMEQASTYGIEIAMDVAFQCSPDHPYVKEHREWFKIQAGWDGAIC